MLGIHNYNNDKVNVILLTITSVILGKLASNLDNINVDNIFFKFAN